MIDNFASGSPKSVEGLDQGSSVLAPGVLDPDVEECCWRQPKTHAHLVSTSSTHMLSVSLLADDLQTLTRFNVVVRCTVKHF
jgi:hypothetical protein